ncbi:MAG TPA: hypothetical protein VNR60_10620 [Croceibacterium sp.]|nr:hypothetical protein [Croceibacterium sp.]
MGIFTRWRACAAVALATMGALALSACIISPGAFQASLDLRKNGQFTYTYDGEIYLLALSQLADMAAEADRADDAYVKQPCYDDEDFDERPCTSAEIAAQKQAWAEQSAARKKSSEQESEALKAMLGGIDPSDPKAAEELAQRLRRQEGWKRVDYRGNGLFDVEFELTSRIGHDFTFPTFERFPMSNSFLVVTLRQEKTVRVEAPGFSAQSGGNPLQGMMSGMAGIFAAAAASQSEGDMPRMPEANGTFRIVTDGQVLANNTDEGPQPDRGGQVLEWTINQRTQAAPMALIKLD